MEEDVEYLDAWPPSRVPETRLRIDKSDNLLIPSESRSHYTTTSSSGSPPQPKKLKHGLAWSCDGGLTDCSGDEHSFDEKSSVNLEQQLSPEELHIVRCDYSVSADALLARWWKMVISAKRSVAGHVTETPRPAEEERVEFIAKSDAAPQTQLYHISRLEKAKFMLQCRIHHLNSLITSKAITTADTEDLSCLHISIANCYKRLAVGAENKDITGCISSALKHCKLALELDSKCEEGLWLCKLLERQKDMETKKMLAIERLSEETAVKRAELTMPNPVQVERRHVDDLSAEEFFQHYAVTHTPVVITGLVEHMTQKPWTLDYIKQSIGDKCAPVKRMVSGSVSWAKLEPDGERKVSEFIDSLDEREESDWQYLFDWSLPINCPDLVKELRIPKYSANDYLQRTPSGSLYQDSWPSLFIAPAGITSELHVDAFGSNFWMALFQGQKRWLFFPPDDVPLLYPILTNSTDATFEVDLSSPDLTLHPLLSLTHPRECTLKAGELLFVPAGCPHRVQNLTKSLAISANFVDGSNLDLVMDELSVNAIQDQRAAQLLRELQQLQGARFGQEVAVGDVDLEKESTFHCVHWDWFKSRIRD